MNFAAFPWGSDISEALNRSGGGGGGGGGGGWEVQL